MDIRLHCVQREKDCLNPVRSSVARGVPEGTLFVLSGRAPIPAFTQNHVQDPGDILKDVHCAILRIA